MSQVYGQCELELSQPPVESRGEVPTGLQEQTYTCDSNKGMAGDGEGREEEGSGGRYDKRRGDKRTEDGELVSLKRALAKQVQRLQELCANEEERVGQDEEEEEREKRVAAEHVAAMARKLYDLQRKVNVCHPWCVYNIVEVFCSLWYHFLSLEVLWLLFCRC